MLACIIKDILNILRYLPLAIFVGAVFYGICFFKAGRFRESGNPFHLCDIWKGLLVVYLVMLFQVALFSREAGSRMDMNLVIGGTWTEDAQGRAYVIENVLLFIPFGMLIPLCLKRIPIFATVLVGFILSLGIEFLQLLTARGYFQVDDLIMNALGCLLGEGVVRIFFLICGYVTKEKSE